MVTMTDLVISLEEMEFNIVSVPRWIEFRRLTLTNNLKDDSTIEKYI